MVQNFPGPYELRFFYTTPESGLTLNHVQRLNLNLTTQPNVGDAFVNINAVTRGGVATPDLATVVEDWLTLIDDEFSTTVSFPNVELWEYTPLTFDAKFISAYSPTANAGVNAAPTIPAQQSIITFRTAEGGILKINLMETVRSAQQQQSFPTGTPSINAIATFVTGSTNWILARDTSYPISRLRWLPGRNEALFKKRFR